MIALWLAAQATSETDEALRLVVTRQARGRFVVIRDGWDGAIAFGRAEVAHVLALLDRPREDVAATVAREWHVLTDASATTRDVASRLGAHAGQRRGCACPLWPVRRRGRLSRTAARSSLHENRMSTARRGGAAAAMVVPTRVARLALRPTVRSMSWLPLLVGAASAGAGMWLTEPWGSQIGAFTALRSTALLLAAGAAFALDDPTTTTLAASPTAPGARRGLRLALLGGVWMGLWALALAVIDTASPHGGLAVAGPTVEAAGMLALALAAVRSLHRTSPKDEGVS